MRKAKLAHVLAVGAVLLGGTVACSDDSADVDGPPEPVGNAPEDRDQEAVHAALGRIDPCALIDPTGAGIKNFSGSSDVEAMTPHSCDVRDDAGSVSVALGVAFSTDDRFNADLDPVAGAKAYVVPSGDLMSCQVALPVSSTHAIVVNAYPEIDVRDPCDDAKAFARAAAKRLKQPRSVSYPDAAITASACDLLGSAVGLSEGEELRGGWERTAGMDECGVAESASDGEAPQSAEVLDSIPTGTRLSISYSGPSLPHDYAMAGKVRGRRLAVNGCTTAWNEPTMRKSADGRVAQLELTGSSCEETKRLVRDITKAIDQDQAAKSAPAQHPVLYRAGQPDAPALGACTDLMDFAESECQPYVETDAPSDGEETIEAAGEDPNVNCAIATDAIEEHYGASLRPVTAIGRLGMHEGDVRRCGFVDESHAIEVWIGVSNEPMQVPGESEIDGHPARDETSTTSSDRVTRDLVVALDDEDAPGLLYGEVVLRPERGREYLGDDAQLDDLDEVMTDIADAHFDT